MGAMNEAQETKNNRFITNPVQSRIGFDDPPAPAPKPTGQLVTAWTTGISSIIGSGASLVNAFKQPTAQQQQEALAQQQALLAQQQAQYGAYPPAGQLPAEEGKDKTGLIVGIIVVVLVIGIGVFAFSKG